LEGDFLEMKNYPELTAIDVLLNPDETLIKRAVEINKTITGGISSWI
jgi:hypothetical protein